MPATFAAYIPVYVPQTHLQRAQTEVQPSNTPWHPPTQQDLIGCGIIALIALSGMLFLNLMDRR